MASENGLLIKSENDCSNHSLIDRFVFFNRKQLRGSFSFMRLIYTIKELHERKVKKEKPCSVMFLIISPKVETNFVVVFFKLMFFLHHLDRLKSGSAGVLKPRRFDVLRFRIGGCFEALVQIRNAQDCI